MGDLAADTAVDGGDGPLHGDAVARLGDLGTERRLHRVDRLAGRGRALALRPAREHRRPLPRRRVVRRAARDRRHDVARGEARGVRSASRSRQGGQPIFDAMVWAVGDVGGLEHDVSEMPDAPDTRITADRRANGSARRVRSARTTRSGATSTSASPTRTGSRTGRTVHRGRRSSVTGTASSRRRRSTIRGSTRAARSSCSTRSAGPRHASCIRGRHTSRRASTLMCAFHRARPEEPWLYAQATAAERGQRADRLREPGVVARRHAARRRREPAALPPDANPVASAADGRSHHAGAVPRDDRRADRRLRRRRDVPERPGAARRRARDLVAQREPRPPRPATRTARVRSPLRVRGRRRLRCTRRRPTASPATTSATTAARARAS